MRRRPRSSLVRARRRGGRRRGAARGGRRPAASRAPRRALRFVGPGHGLAVGAWALPSLVGRGRALDLCLTMRCGRRARRRCAIGLVDRVADDADAAALALAAEIAALDPAAVAAREVRRGDRAPRGPRRSRPRRRQPRRLGRLAGARMSPWLSRTRRASRAGSATSAGRSIPPRCGPSSPPARCRRRSPPPRPRRGDAPALEVDGAGGDARRARRAGGARRAAALRERGRRARATACCWRAELARARRRLPRDPARRGDRGARPTRALTAGELAHLLGDAEPAAAVVVGPGPRAARGRRGRPVAGRRRSRRTAAARAGGPRWTAPRCRPGPRTLPRCSPTRRAPPGARRASRSRTATCWPRSAPPCGRGAGARTTSSSTRCRSRTSTGSAASTRRCSPGSRAVVCSALRRRARCAAALDARGHGAVRGPGDVRAARVERSRAGWLLRLAVSGSAPLPPGAGRARSPAALGELPLERYGSTEAGPERLEPLRRPAPRRAPSGLPLPGVEVAPRARTARSLAARPAGLRRLLGRPEATAEALTADGWFRTGDARRASTPTAGSRSPAASRS